MPRVAKNPPLQTLDLFSGCAGITHGLRGAAHPIGYCEIAVQAQNVLKSLMDRKLIPRAPIHEDVSTLDGKALGHVDMIAGGFPCTAISTAGKREGLSHPASGLFYQIVRLAEDTKAPFLFLENVAAITQVNSEKGRSVLQECIEALDKVGYDMSYVCLEGYQVGAPQRRRRWFALCHRRGIRDYTIDFPKHERFDWSKEPCARMIPKTDRKRASILGNSVIPDVVTLAFRLLWTGLRLTVDEAWALEGPTKFEPTRMGKPVAVPGRFGVARDGLSYATNTPRGLIPEPDLNITLDPSVMPYNDKYTGPNRITEPTSIPLWPTCRYGNGCHAGRTLTKRARGDLATVCRFATGTADDQRGGHMNPDFIEFLMGYDAGWTLGN